MPDGPWRRRSSGTYLGERVTVGNVCILYNTCTDSTSVIRKKKRGKKSPRGQFLRPALKNVCVTRTEVPCCDIWEAVLRLLSETHFAAVKTSRQAAGLLLPRPC